MRKYALAGIGGGLGTLIRFGMTEWMATLPVCPFTAVLVVNISGCFFISFLSFLSGPTGEIYFGPNSRVFLLVGICGGYTTFSTFSLISFNAVSHRDFLDLCLNIGLSHLLCLTAVWLGAMTVAQFRRVMMRLFHQVRN